LISRQKATRFRGVRPDHGGRLELKLVQASETRADYLLTLFTPDGERSAQATLDAPGDALELADFSGATPPAWLMGYAQALLRSVLRTKRSDGVWPRRLTRWRPEPKA